MDEMKNQIELLAPGGDLESIKAAILAGADAIYCGLNKFNARNRATNINFENLQGIIHLAHQHDCKVFLTLNIIIVGSEMPAVFRLLNKLVNIPIDGVIIQDLGLLYLISTYFKTLNVHASTQLNTHNDGQIKFLNMLGVNRVNLSRELNLVEIKALTMTGHENNILTEVFVHGSLCLCFSGLCYMSSVLKGNSGNRGRCSQPCRDRYLTTSAGKNFPLNLKDNSAYLDFKELVDARVGALKIEGRIKRSDYVYTVVKCWKDQIQNLYHHKPLSTDNSELYKVFNRDFSNGYLKGDIDKNMFIDNPMDNSIQQFSKIEGALANKAQSEDETAYYDEKNRIVDHVNQQIESASIEKLPLVIKLSGKKDTPLQIHVKSPDTSFLLTSKKNLAITKTHHDNKKTTPKTLNDRDLLRRLGAINETKYYIQHLDTRSLEKNLFISFTEFTVMKNQILFLLNDSKETIDPIDLPFLKKEKQSEEPPGLSILISSIKDVSVCSTGNAQVFFQLPNSFSHQIDTFVSLFKDNKDLIPWFPSVLIEENYTAAIQFLDQVKPDQLVTNNAGIAYEAFMRKISWIAGPDLNIVNSFGLVCLKERFNCSGAFISNEISKHQIKRIIKPENFKLYYSMYHPILLLSSRQCLHHQVIGCKKNRMDNDCLNTCQKFSTLMTLDNTPLYIEKRKGHYHCIYNDVHFLNTDIIDDIPNLFSRFHIDLREIKNHTTINADNSSLIKAFQNLLNQVPESKTKLRQMIHSTIDTQYKKGI